MGGGVSLPGFAVCGSRQGAQGTRRADAIVRSPGHGPGALSVQPMPARRSEVGTRGDGSRFEPSEEPTNQRQPVARLAISIANDILIAMRWWLVICFAG